MSSRNPIALMMPYAASLVLVGSTYTRAAETTTTSTQEARVITAPSTQPGQSDTARHVLPYLAPKEDTHWRPFTRQEATQERESAGQTLATRWTRPSPTQRTTQKITPSDFTLYGSLAPQPPNTSPQWQGSQAARQETHWQPAAGVRQFGWYGAGPLAPRETGAAPAKWAPYQNAGARYDLYSTGSGTYFPGYMNRDGSVDRYDTRTGAYFYGIKNRRGSQDLFDSRTGQWYYGFRNPDGSVDYLGPNGRWIWSAGRGSALP